MNSTTTYEVPDDLTDEELAAKGGGGALASEKLSAIRPRPFTIWRVSDFERFTPPADNAILGDDAGRVFWRDGQIALLIGPGGVGKSRLSLNWAVLQILGGARCGFKFFGPPRTWLFLGNENSTQRLKSDVAKLCAGLSVEQRALVEEHLAIQGPDPEGDDDLNLDDDKTVARLRLTAAAIKPDVVVFDPWEGVIKGADCNDAAATRESARLLKSIFYRHSARCSLLVIHHAREGAEAARKAEGFDAGAYAKGSKTLRSISRFAINVAPQDPQDGGRIVLACGKSNDEQPFSTRGAVLDESTGAYELDHDFDLDAWRADVEGRRGGKACAIRDVWEAVRAGQHSTGDIVRTVAGGTGASLRTIKRRLADAVHEHYLQPCPPRGHYTLGDKRP